MISDLENMDGGENAELTEQEKRAAWRMAEVVLDHIGLNRLRVIRWCLLNATVECKRCGHKPGLPAKMDRRKGSSGRWATQHSKLRTHN